MTKEINKALKEATKNLKELADTPQSKNVSLFQVTTVNNGKKITVSNLHYADDMTELINAFTAVLNDNPELAHLMGHENMKKELAKMDMSEQEVKDYIETFDQNVSKAMKTIKENFNKD